MKSWSVVDFGVGFCAGFSLRFLGPFFPWEKKTWRERIRFKSQSTQRAATRITSESLEERVWRSQLEPQWFEPLRFQLASRLDLKSLAILASREHLNLEAKIYTPILREGVSHKHLQDALVYMSFPSFSLENNPVWYTPNLFFACWGAWVFRAENTFGVYFSLQKFKIGGRVGEELKGRLLNFSFDKCVRIDLPVLCLSPPRPPPEPGLMPLPQGHQ